MGWERMGWDGMEHLLHGRLTTRQLEGGQQDATQPRAVPTGAGTADWNRRLEPHRRLELHNCRNWNWNWKREGGYGLPR